MKIQVTQQQRDNALFARDVMWPSVPPENVMPRLDDWRGSMNDPHTAPRRVNCRTLACFGGWVAVNPHFKAQGVKATGYGAPTDRQWRCAAFISEDLFGDFDLFSYRQANERGTDHEIVTKRLDRLIRNSEVA